MKHLQHILVIDDERAIREMIGFALRRSGFTCAEVDSVAAAEQQLKVQVPDLILVDWMLPTVSGVQFIEFVREHECYAKIPVIMLTARTSDENKVEGLDAGADDYVCKPFSPKELMARIRARLRRSCAHGSDIVTVGGLHIDERAHRVSYYGRIVEIAPTEYKFLRVLMGNVDRVLSRAQLVDHVWGYGVDVEERTVDVHVLRLRKALASCGCDAMVQTVRGAGYRLSEV